MKKRILGVIVSVPTAVVIKTALIAARLTYLNNEHDQSISIITCNNQLTSLPGLQDLSVAEPRSSVNVSEATSS